MKMKSPRKEEAHSERDHEDVVDAGEEEVGLGNERRRDERRFSLGS